jgi:CRP/FNR family transcriptional regulator
MPGDVHNGDAGENAAHGGHRRRARSLAAMPGLWDALVADSEVIDIAAGQLIYDAGKPAPVVAILSGGARGFVWVAGGRQLTFRYAGPGDLIGLGPRLGGLDSSNAEAITDTRAAFVPLSRVRELVLGDPAVAWILVEQIATWASDLVGNVAAGSRVPMTARVARHLLEVAQPTSGGVAANVTHQRLADAVGTAREVVTRTLGAMRRAGIVQTQPGRVVIVDPQRMSRLASGGEVTANAPNA